MIYCDCCNRFSHITSYAASCLNEATLFEATDDLEEERIDILPPAIINPETEGKDTNGEESGSTPSARSIGVSEMDKDAPADQLCCCAWGKEPLKYGAPEILYGIKTENDDLICVISVSRICIIAGDVIQLWLSFDQTTQRSHSVTATLLQREVRSSDGAILKVCIQNMHIYVQLKCFYF